MKNIFFILTFAVALNANANLIGSVWNQNSELKVDSTLFCSGDSSKAAKFYSHGGYLRVDRWNLGWFRIEAGGGCSSWFGNSSFAFQQVGSDIFDRFGNKVGKYSTDEITLFGGADWDNQAKITSLHLKLNSDGTANIQADFTHINHFGYSNFEFTSNLTPWQ